MSITITSAQSAGDSIADILTEREGEMVKVTGVFTNTTGSKVEGYEYKLKIIRKGKTGTSSSNQSGKISAEADESVTLSTSSINVSEGDEYIFQLTIMDTEGTVIAEKELTQNK